MSCCSSTTQTAVRDSIRIGTLLLLAACAEGNLTGRAPSAPVSPLAPEVAIALPSTMTSAAPDTSSSAETLYTCPMHPEVVTHAPGKCPKCAMTLVPKTQ